METLKQRIFGFDALRAVAVTLVLVCHASIMVFPWFGWSAPLPLVYGGTYGVTLFFTLSGFLIGRILIRLAAQGAGWRDWLSFMRRRWARTLPLYGLWLLVLAEVWPPHALDPGARERLWQALPWFATLTQNLAWPMRADWFAVSWSLCVEEWFYLVFSAALLAGGALLGRRLAFWTVLGLFLLVPPVLRACAPGWSAAIHADSGIVLLRLDAVGYGVLAAWLSLHAPAVMRYRRAALAVGLGMAVLLLEGGFNPLLHLLGRWGDAATLVILPLGFALCLPAAAAATRAPAWLRRPVEAYWNG
jgi:peptidoglycan/LPS O-acetylase OafA/YrhL